MPPGAAGVCCAVCHTLTVGLFITRSAGSNYDNDRSDFRHADQDP
ncbi:MAG: hypothetical protein JXQ83_01475 [Candidatus Glassbacteria bacterium]|nr:hypothetical protein [Candidatus Glassbacteria bacterium]